MVYIKKFNEFINEELNKKLSDDVFNEIKDKSYDTKEYDQRMLNRFKELFTSDIVKEFSECIEIELRNSCDDYVGDHFEYEEPGTYKIREDDYEEYGGLTGSWDDYYDEIFINDGKYKISPELQYLNMSVNMSNDGVESIFIDDGIELPLDEYENLYNLVNQIFARCQDMAENNEVEGSKAHLEWEKQKQDLMRDFI